MDAPTTDRRLLQDYRLGKLEEHAQSTQTSVRAIEDAMLQIRDTLEASAREASEYRRETRRDIRRNTLAIECIEKTWGHYKPIIDRVEEREQDAKDLRKKATTGWLTAAGLAVGGAITEFVRRHWGA